MGTLTDAPERATLLIDRRTIQTKQELGMVQRRQTQSATSSNFNKAQVRSWFYEYGSAPLTVRDRILELWDDTKGGAVSLTVTPTDESSAISARFSSPLQVVQLNASRWRLAFTLEEVL